MAITYPINIPTTIGIEQIQFRAVNAVGVTESPFTFKQQVVKHQGERWEAVVRIPPVKADLAEAWVAFLLKLKGPFGTFLMGDPSRKSPRGSAVTIPGTPLVQGGSQTGEEIIIDGLPTSTSGYLLAGDYVQIGSGLNTTLHKVLDDADTDSSGVTVLNIWPSLINAPADNAPVIVSDTVGLWRLKNPISDWTINNISSFGIEFEAVGVVE